MDDELKLGFLRLGKRLEDPVNMGVGLVCAWAIIALTVAIAHAMGPGRRCSWSFAASPWRCSCGGR
jgi:hypothetical protein